MYYKNTQIIIMAYSKTKPTPMPKNKGKFRQWKREQNDMTYKHQQIKRLSKLTYKAHSVARFDKYFIEWENEEN